MNTSRTFIIPRDTNAWVLACLIVFSWVCPARAEPLDQTIRQLIGWGWQDARHGQSLASDALGQFADGDPARPSFGSYGPYGGANDHGFFLFTYGSGSRWCQSGLAAHPGIGKLAMPDYWNHRVLLFDLKPDGSLASRRASGLIGQRASTRWKSAAGPSVPHVQKEHYLEIAAEFLKPHLPQAVNIELDPGDVVLFHNLLFHQGQPNRTQIIRWSLDWRYQDATQPTLRAEQGHLARSRRDPSSAVQSHVQWSQLSFS